MLKVKSRTDLHAVAGTKPEKPTVDKMAGVTAAMIHLAECVQKTSDMVAQNTQAQTKHSAEIERLATLTATKPPISLNCEVERHKSGELEGKMKRIVITQKSAG